MSLAISQVVLSSAFNPFFNVGVIEEAGYRIQCRFPFVIRLLIPVKPSLTQGQRRKQAKKPPCGVPDEAESKLET